MNLHDPQRPKLANGVATLASEKIICALPSFTITSEAEGLLRVMVFLPSGPSRFAPRHVRMKLWDLPDLLTQYEEDPEGALEKWFGWSLREAERSAEQEDQRSSPKTPVAPISKTESSAEDLGF